ncbi:hypothetical protein [Brevibacillus aydinogluensis]|jgi:hypothetical protein|uniref:Transposase n=1 Tax=Brevibacillus aydinogluensis TaxID=927786 RepID=A0AA48M9Q9_9BACL|nr:hypothetical protein [Brevibacillus aydinogluensis]CAJ1003889.1 Transposase [Brevibacillus aydinogluensis]
MNRGRIQARLDEVKRRLEMYYKAEAAILEGAQSYQMGSRQLSRAALPSVQAEIRELEKRKQELETALATGTEKRKSYRILYRDL